MAERICSIPDCGTGGLIRRGWCVKHYERWRHHGDALANPAFIVRDDLANFWSYVTPLDDETCWEWQGPSKGHAVGGKHYGATPWQGRRQLAHRVSLMIALDRTLKSSELVLHHCDNPPCVNPCHLYVGDHAQNMRDARVRGRAVGFYEPGDTAGTKNWNAKLTESDIVDIRERLAAGETQQSIADSYEVDRTLISLIKRRKVWTHVPG